MRPLNIFRIEPSSKTRALVAFPLAALMFSVLAFSQAAQAQSPAQLSLADILIGLRSKKVTIEERNKLLSDAVKERGITFALTAEIEDELKDGGATGELVAAIKEKSPKAAANQPAIIPASMNTPAAPAEDAAFYRNRGNENNLRGELELALEDYAKAIELNPKDTASYFNRGRVYANQKSFDLALMDFNKSIELNPKDVFAYTNRAAVYEKKGETDKAVADYQKAVEMDANNASAKTNLKRLQDDLAKQTLAKQKQDELAKLQAKTTPAAPAPVVEEKKPAPAPAVVEAPKSLELGELKNNALKLAMPVYPEIARKLNAQGKVVVIVTLDEAGKVVSAKASSGNSLLRGASEDAAKQSKFKPAMFNGQPIKSTGFITYNFVDAP